MRGSSGVAARRKTSRPGARASSRKPARTAPQPALPQFRKDQWTVATLVAIFVAMPLAILPASIPTYNTTPKLVVLCLAAALLFWFADRWWSALRIFWQTVPGRRFLILLISAAASLLAASALSGQAWLSFAGTPWRRLGAVEQLLLLAIAAAVAAHVYLERTAAPRLLLAIEAAAALASVYAILQYAGWDPLIPPSAYTLGSPPALRPPATLGQSTYFGAFLLAPILIAAWLRLRATSWRWKRTHEAVLCLTVAALILSGTRAALLGLIAAAPLLLYAQRSRLGKTNLARAGVLALAAVSIATLFVLSPAGRPVRARVAQWTADRSGGPRLLVWRDSLPLIWRYPIFGIGPERFEAEFRRIESLDLARAYPDHYNESPHNLVLEIAVSQGLLGLAAWTALFGFACWSAWSGLRRRDEIVAPIAAALLAMLIALQFCPLTLANELYVLALGAIAVGLCAPKAVVEPIPALNRSWLACARAAGICVVLLAAAFAAQTTLFDLTSRRVFKQDLAGATRSYEAARIFPMPGSDLLISQQAANIAKTSSPTMRAEALELAKRAAHDAERKSADGFNGSYQSAMLATVGGNLPDAEACLRRTLHAAPTWYRPRMALASVLCWEGRDREAQQEADAALNCAGRMQANVRRTLQTARAQASLIALQGKR
jgi:O-antigen ligase